MTPTNLKYSNEHEWIRLESDNTAYIGITDYAQGQLGDIVFVDVNAVGETLNQKEVFGAVEAVKTVSDLFLPVGGKIVELNPELDSTPELVNKDPYGKGWIIKVEVTNPSELDGLLDAAAYDKFTGK